MAQFSFKGRCLLPPFDMNETLYMNETSWVASDPLNFLRSLVEFGLKERRDGEMRQFRARFDRRFVKDHYFGPKRFACGLPENTTVQVYRPSGREPPGVREEGRGHPHVECRAARLTGCKFFNDEGFYRVLALA
jgi:hypothetical protein